MKFKVFEYYSREDVLQKLFENSKNREVVGAYVDGNYDVRPNVFQYENDILQMVKKGVTSFHYSVERWSHPMQLIESKYDELRIGWDFIIDIDSKIGIEGAQLAAVLICNFLEKYGIRNYGIKFSGSRGFHICLPFEMFPKEVDYKPLAKQYPKISRILARFLRSKIRNELMKELMKRKSAKELIELLEEPPERLDPFYFIEIEKDWGPRHLFRASYSLNEKTWLVSLPIDFSRLKNFSIDMANPQTIKVDEEFFKGEENEAELLLLEAMDWYAMRKKEIVKKEKPKIIWEKKIDENLFPPCMKNILSGLSDGKKRSIFTLVNFLRMMNWPWPEIEAKLFEWNEKNSPRIPRTILTGQLRWNEMQHKALNPANCSNDLFYKSIGICKPDEICKKIKNPISYPFKKMDFRFRKIRTRGFSCDVCNREFKTMKNLMTHKRRMH